MEDKACQSEGVEVEEPEGENAKDVEITRMDEFQDSLPPLLSSLLGELRHSFSQRKKEYLIGLGAFIVFLVILGMIFYFIYCPMLIFIGFCSILLLGLTKVESTSSEDLIVGGTTETFIIGPINITHSPLFIRQYSDSFFNISKPSGSIQIHHMDITLVDKNGNVIPLSVVYSHHIIIASFETEAFIGGVRY